MELVCMRGKFCVFSTTFVRQVDVSIYNGVWWVNIEVRQTIAATDLKAV